MKISIIVLAMISLALTNTIIDANNKHLKDYQFEFCDKSVGIFDVSEYHTNNSHFSIAPAYE